MYETLLLIDPDSDIPPDVSRLKSKLDEFYSGDKLGPNEIKRSEDRITLSWGKYSLYITYSNLPNVLIESQEIANKYGKNYGNTNRIMLCDSRFELHGDDDPDMNHFNDYLFIIEVIQKIWRIFPFDTASCEFTM